MRNYIHIIFFLFLLISVFLFGSHSNIYAQGNKAAIKALLKNAEENYELGKFRDALPLYKRLLALRPGDPNYNYNLGYCHLRTGIEKSEAIPRLEFAAEHRDEKKIPPEIDFDLAIAYQSALRFDEAIASFERYNAGGKAKSDLVEKANIRIEQCKNGIMLVKKPVDVVIENMGEKINSSYQEYCPIMSRGESFFIFSSTRKGSVGGYLGPGGEYFSDIYISYKKRGQWSKVKNIGRMINSETTDIAVCLSPDEQQLIINSDKFQFGVGDLWVSGLRGW
ncbi:tetratricopeptide repeat protein [bacterium AH-315-C07]|nr:tetratricopeptide repeat protein [bacterium AH-315-C07]